MGHVLTATPRSIGRTTHYPNHLLIGYCPLTLLNKNTLIIGEALSPLSIFLISSGGQLVQRMNEPSSLLFIPPLRSASPEGARCSFRSHLFILGICNYQWNDIFLIDSIKEDYVFNVNGRIYEGM